MKIFPLPPALQKSWIRAAGALLFVLLLGMAFNPGGPFNGDGAFYQWGTHRDMLRQISVYGILACGMTLVILTGGIDLAVGSVLGFSSVIFSLLSLHWGWNGALAFGVCLLGGAFMGMVSGVTIARWRLQPFIATLAMMVFARGLAKWISGGQKISQAVMDTEGNYRYLDLPKIFSLLDGKILGENLAVVTLVFLLCLAAGSLFLHKFRWGRYFYAVGGNEEASRLSGVPVMGTKIAAYTLSGLLAALAGICQAAQEHQGDPEAGGGYELTAIAIVVIGGTHLNGGKGNLGLTLLGALTIGYLEKILSINAVGESSRLMLTGVIIIGAVLLQRSRNR